MTAKLSGISRYLGSTKNLVGSAAGLAGVALHLFGLAGGYWLLVVAGLYLAGALLTPPDRIRLVHNDSAVEAGQLRTELDTVTRTVREQGSRMPDTAVDQVARIAEVLTSMLERPSELTANPDVLHSVTRLARVDLPLSVQTYLNMPWWFAVARRTAKDSTAADELMTQLRLLEQDAHRIATEFYATDIHRQADHTRYLRERSIDDRDPT